MTIYKPELAAVDRIPMRVTHPRHMVSLKQGYTSSGAALSALGEKVGAEGAIRSGAFEDIMLRALDQVSSLQQESSSLVQAAVTDPESVDSHDITIAQAKANMSLNITRTILSRFVQSWRDLINTR